MKDLGYSINVIVTVIKMKQFQVLIRWDQRKKSFKRLSIFPPESQSLFAWYRHRGGQTGSVKDFRAYFRRQATPEAGKMTNIMIKRSCLNGMEFRKMVEGDSVIGRGTEKVNK